MKDNYELVTTLQHLLSNELVDIREDLVLSEMCAGAGFEKSHQVIKQQALRKIRHAGWLMQYIILLNGGPERSQIDPKEFGVGDWTKRLPFRADRKRESVKHHELGLPLFAFPDTNEQPAAGGPAEKPYQVGQPPLMATQSGNPQNSLLSTLKAKSGEIYRSSSV